MDEQRYIAFIEGLISQTKMNKLEWQYLDKNKELYKGMQWTEQAHEFELLALWDQTPDFNTDDSFYVPYKDAYIVLLVRGNKPAELYVVPKTYKSVVVLKPEKYGDSITRLLNLVQSLHPNADAVIDSFLNALKEQQINTLEETPHADES